MTSPGPTPELAHPAVDNLPADEQRFAFGRNWQSFLRLLDEERIQTATASLTAMLDQRELRLRYFPDDPCWEVREGSALDEAFLAALGDFDVVYSWGVLHHTGDLWRALRLILRPLRPGGQLFIAIYNDQGAWSSRWTTLKRLYCSSRLWRAAIVGTIIPYWVLRGLAADLVWGRNPLRQYTEYRGGRGMSVWHDWIDWLGGYPFEVAKPEQILDFYRGHGFVLTRLRTAGGSPGCNEFVFQLPANRNTRPT